MGALDEGDDATWRLGRAPMVLAAQQEDVRKRECERFEPQCTWFGMCPRPPGGGRFSRQNTLPIEGVSMGKLGSQRSVNQVLCIEVMAERKRISMRANFGQRTLTSQQQGECPGS